MIKKKNSCLHRTKEEDDDRTRIYKGLEMDGAIMYGKPDRIPPLWHAWNHGNGNGIST